MAASDAVRILSTSDAPPLALLDGEGSARAVVWSGTGARLRAMHLIVLRPGARTISQRHDGEAVYAVLDGGGTVVDESDGSTQQLETGSMVHAERSTPYRFAAGDGGMRLVGGPAPVDESLYVSVTA
jgi:quercetin dioxygenase-like cupin family protein